MKYIEFLGQPGAGKTTLMTSLAGGHKGRLHVYEDSVERRFLQNARKRFTLLYPLVPNSFRSFIFEQLEYKYHDRSLREFMTEYPDFLYAMATLAEQTSRKTQFYDWCLRSAEEYQMGMTTLAESETLCLDWNLYHLGAHLMTETSPNLPYSEFTSYFSAIPTPDVLVHVDAPPKVCLSRQRDRGSDDSTILSATHAPEYYSDTLSVQQSFQESCHTVCDNSPPGTDVIHVMNTGSAEEAINEIARKLDCI